MSDDPNHIKRILQCGLYGILCTVLLAITGFVLANITNSRTIACIFLWQACLVQEMAHGSGTEGTPVDVFTFFFGILLGVPVYGLVSYAYLAWQKKMSAGRTD